MLQDIDENGASHSRSRCDTYSLYGRARKTKALSMFKYPARTSTNETIKELSAITSNLALRTPKRKFGSSIDSGFRYTAANYSKPHNSAARKRDFLITDGRDVDRLQTTLETVARQNLRLKQLSTEIMLDQRQNREMTSTVHSFYQNVVIPESEGNIALLEEEVRSYKLEVAKLSACCGRMKKEIANLNRIIAHYQELEFAKPQVKAFAQGKVIMIKGTKSKSPSKAESSKDIAAKDHIHMDSVLNSLRRISKSTTTRILIETLYKELEVLFKGCRSGIFIVHPGLQRLHQKENGSSKPITLENFMVALAANGKTQSAMRPIFTTLGMTKDLIRTNEAITIPIICQNSKSGKEVYMVIQLEGFKLKLTHESELLVCYMNIR